MTFLYCLRVYRGQKRSPTRTGCWADRRCVATFLDVGGHHGCCERVQTAVLGDCVAELAVARDDQLLSGAGRRSHQHAVSSGKHTRHAREAGGTRERGLYLGFGRRGDDDGQGLCRVDEVLQVLLQDAAKVVARDALWIQGSPKPD